MKITSWFLQRHREQNSWQMGSHEGPWEEGGRLEKYVPLCPGSMHWRSSGLTCPGRVPHTCPFFIIHRLTFSRVPVVCSMLGLAPVPQQQSRKGLALRIRERTTDCAACPRDPAESGLGEGRWGCGQHTGLPRRGVQAGSWEQGRMDCRSRGPRQNNP